MKRTTVRSNFSNYKMHRDKRTMDEICTSESGAFELQKHQKFLQEWTKKNFDKIRSMLLYHSLGSGKTITSITIAEQCMQINPKYKTIVVTPARLKTNFYDELLLLSKYGDLESKADQQREIHKNYDIMSFENIKKLAKQSTSSLSQWAREFTQNRIILIDEVHNIFSSNYDNNNYSKVKETDSLNHKLKGTLSILFKQILLHAHPSAKFFFLTATPIFDNKRQFKELLQLFEPKIEIDKSIKLSDALKYLRGRVSFFPGVSPNAYPTSRYVEHDIPLTSLQDSMMAEAAKAKIGDPDHDSFMGQQRQIAISVLGSRPATKNNIMKYAPKIYDAVETIESLPGKHVVYSTFIKHGLTVMEAELQRRGWTRYEIGKDKSTEGKNKSKNKSKSNPTKLTKLTETTKTTKIKTTTSDDNSNEKHKKYVVWDGTLKDAHKTAIKKIVNSQANVDGSIIRLVLGSPSIKEGVSFKHVQHMHLLDPVWNPSAKRQVEGRAIRFCSHSGVPKNHPFLKRNVDVHVYKSTHLPDGEVETTCDEIIYDKIIPEKQYDIEILENLLKKVSIDYFLFRELYETEKVVESAKYIGKDDVSPIPINPEDDFLLRRKNKKEIKVRNTCPKKRRPDEDDVCPQPNQEMRINKNDNKCCYIVRKSTKAARPSKKKSS